MLLLQTQRPTTISSHGTPAPKHHHSTTTGVSVTITADTFYHRSLANYCNDRLIVYIHIYAQHEKKAGAFLQFPGGR
ncbi:hypothetical protein BDFB_002954, partial [Asbolus verrucosus]